MHQKIDILMGTYNGEKYLRAQIDSIFDQSFRDFKLLIKDDNSQDCTSEILKEYKKNLPKKVDIIFNHSSPYGSKLNYSSLINLSQAPYIMLADQDDVWLPTKVEKSIKAIQELEVRYPNDIPLLVHTDLQVVDESLNSIAPSFWTYSRLSHRNTSLNRLLVQNVITGCTVIFNRALADIASPIPDEALMHDHWLALTTSALGYIGVIEEATVLYRQHGTNVLGAKKWRWTIPNILREAYKILYQPEGKKKIKQYYQQAKALHRAVSSQIKGREKEILESFVSIDEKSYLQRARTMIRYQILKGNWAQNIGLLLRS